jgi:hypothetical protein
MASTQNDMKPQGKREDRSNFVERPRRLEQATREAPFSYCQGKRSSDRGSGTRICQKDEESAEKYGVKLMRFGTAKKAGFRLLTIYCVILLFAPLQRKSTDEVGKLLCSLKRN